MSVCLVGYVRGYEQTIEKQTTVNTIFSERYEDVAELGLSYGVP